MSFQNLAKEMVEKDLENLKNNEFNEKKFLKKLINKNQKNIQRLSISFNRRCF